jgi:hypothetical protein
MESFHNSLFIALLLRSSSQASRIRTTKELGYSPRVTWKAGIAETPHLFPAGEPGLHYEASD